MTYNAKGRNLYRDYSDKDSFSRGSSVVKTENALQRAAKKYLSSLPEEFKYTIPELMIKLNPGYLNPKHLKPLMDAFDRIQAGKRINFLVSVPPRHAKTETLMHAIARFMVTHKNKEVFYLSYAQDQAEKKSSTVRDYVKRLGVDTVKDTNSLATWKLTNGCVFHCAGLAGGQITGKGADLLIIDDPHKDRADVESGAKREKVHSSVTADVFTRLSPDASVIIVHTRWHPDDLIGRMLKSEDIAFECLSLPAYKSDGTPQWPERWTVERLEEQRKRVGKYEWDSLYMCNPRPRGSTLFAEPNYYKVAPPMDKMTIGIGYDLAYTQKTKADYSVAIVMGYDGKFFYVLDIKRMQVEATEFSIKLWELKQKYPRAPFMSYIAGPEKGVVSLLNSTGLNLSFLMANTDKFLRAQSVSAAWNAGKVLLPESAQWLNSFITEISHFTGVSDPQDDQIDALAGAYANFINRPVRRDLRNLFPV